MYVVPKATKLCGAQGSPASSLSTFKRRRQSTGLAPAACLLFPPAACLLLHQHHIVTSSIDRDISGFKPLAPTVEQCITSPLNALQILEGGGSQGHRVLLLNDVVVTVPVIAEVLLSVLKNASRKGCYDSTTDTT